MLQAGCIYLGVITPCPEDLSPPAPVQMPSQLKNTQNIPPDERFPCRFHKPPFKYEASLIPLRLSLVIRPTATPPRLNKGNLLPLRLSLFSASAQSKPYNQHCPREEGKQAVKTQAA